MIDFKRLIDVRETGREIAFVGVVLGVGELLGLKSRKTGDVGVFGDEREESIGSRTLA